MRIFYPAAITAVLFAGNALGADPVCNIVAGASIVAQDSRSTFLGTISGRGEKDSIFNEYGTYGNQLKGTSIWNEYSEFGSTWNLYSPFNTTSVAPPVLVKSGQVIGYLTANTNTSKSVTPQYLRKACKNFF